MPSKKNQKTINIHLKQYQCHCVSFKIIQEPDSIFFTNISQIVDIFSTLHFLNYTNDECFDDVFKEKIDIIMPVLPQS